MTEDNERYIRATEIVANAIGKSAGERDDFLAEACGGDTTLRRDVETLLVTLPEGQALFDASTLHADVASAPMHNVADREDRSGEIVSHYRLEEFIGEGGMGEVYRGWDVALGRPVAIKLLRGGVNPDLRARLLLEAETTARVYHPAVATFYESGTADDVDFLAMEFVEGQTLRSRLAVGAMEASQVLSMTSSLLEALVHFHAAGIIHRDIKPENIMLGEGRGVVKLLDFGIAKDLGAVMGHSAGAKKAILKTQLTSHGMIVGTLGYMSPEQLRGDPVSVTTDLFALGAVMYESLTGQPAFPGKSVAERVASVLTRDLPPLPVEGHSTDLDLILRRAVARDPADRYPDARSFLRELRGFATGQAVAVLPNTLAILDLENVTGNPDDDWIGMGLAESLSADLGHADGVDLVPRAKVQRLAGGFEVSGTRSDPSDIGLAVGCRWILTGSYQRVGPLLRLTVRLVEVSTGKEIWAEKIDGKLEDIFDVQDRLARLVADSLHVVRPEAMTAPAEQNLDVFELVARAMEGFPSTDRAATDRSDELIDRALELDPHYAPALAVKASIHAPQKFLQTNDPSHLEAALQYAGRALESDPKLATAHQTIGYVRFRQGRQIEAIEAFERAEDLDPSDGNTHYFRGICLLELGRDEEGVAALQHANMLAPDTTHIVRMLASAHLGDWNLEAAEWAFRRAAELDRKTGQGGWSVGARLAECLRRAGRLDEARAECMQALAEIEHSDSVLRSTNHPGLLIKLGQVALDQGDVESAQVAFSQAESIIRAQPDAPAKRSMLIEALAGLARAGAGEQYFDAALSELEAREFGHATAAPRSAKADALFQLTLAAEALGRLSRARQLLGEAQEAGSVLAQRHEIP